MIPIPNPEDYDVSPRNGFLPTEPPLEALPDSYYSPWEHAVKNLQGLILSKRLREVVDRLPVLTTDRLFGEAQWRRAYSVLAFIAHAYIWGGNKPAERVPPPITIPFLSVCEHLQLPPVATYAGLVLWNWKPIFDTERVDTLANLDIIDTFTGSLDEKWFYLISVAIEAKGGPLIPLMLQAIESASRGNRAAVTQSLRTFAERLDDIGITLTRMYDDCDPHIFYNRIRPFLAGGKGMADAGLPNGVIFDNGGPINKQRYVQFSGGSNAQSSVIQFFDLVLSIEHRPTGEETKSDPSADKSHKPKAPPSNFIHEMRKYMPGPHARFLEQVAAVANLRHFVQQHSYDRDLTVAFDACLAMLSALRDKHIQMVSRYIVIQSHAAKKTQQQQQQQDAPHAPNQATKLNLAHRPKQPSADGKEDKELKRDLKGTGGSSLIPFLRQAREETGEPAVDVWARRVLSRKRGDELEIGGADEDHWRTQGISGVWQLSDSDGGLCYN
ncbi:Indoleamine 2,3-dioxygenase [Neohortaea acidophila]|uniref:Indoleamine 2,3-dioxygenase n=1 Tax=Neohortaea acidophila TaxID=245834 RepID=A0A6A6PW79_9PEZI|nr:Indoleamine 2,3-dioxygenase [Neohortaea acidophila]KAF2484026.1 Indoleamine 2,3-dioxygenase [Neohortaea acidophila]